MINSKKNVPTKTFSYALPPINVPQNPIATRPSRFEIISTLDI